MNNRNTLIIASLLILASIVISLAVWNKLPEPMASHWDINDQVNGYMPRFWGAFLTPLITIGLMLLFLVIPSIDPLKANIAKFRPAFNGFIVFLVAFMLVVHILTLAWNLGFQGFRMSMMMLPFMGILFIYAGYLMRTSKRNFFIGIRTPWTLSSDRVWEQTHKVGSVAFMICGVLAFAGAFLGGMAAFWVLLVPLFATSLGLIIYSYVLYRAEMGE